MNNMLLFHDHLSTCNSVAILDLTLRGGQLVLWFCMAIV